MTTISNSIIKRLVVGGLVAAAAAAPIALAAAPAEASTSSGCTVTPLKPTFGGFNSSGVKLVRYGVSIKCASDRSVTVDQDRFDTAGVPVLTGVSVLKHSFGGAGTVKITVQRPLPDLNRGNEAVFQSVRFRVASHGVTSAWTGWQKSAVLSIPN